MTTRNNAGKTRGRPFQPGNPGRPKGARHKVTVAVEALLGNEADKLTRKAVEMALAGDTTALRLCLERICPPLKSRPVRLDLPPVETASDVDKAMAVVAREMADGELTPDEAAQVVGLLEAKRRAIETVELEERLRRLEEAQGR